MKKEKTNDYTELENNKECKGNFWLNGRNDCFSKTPVHKLNDEILSNCCVERCSVSNTTVAQVLNWRANETTKLHRHHVTDTNTIANLN